MINAYDRMPIFECPKVIISQHISFVPLLSAKRAYQVAQLRDHVLASHTVRQVALQHDEINPVRLSKKALDAPTYLTGPIIIGRKSNGGSEGINDVWYCCRIRVTSCACVTTLNVWIRRNLKADNNAYKHVFMRVRSTQRCIVKAPLRRKRLLLTPIERSAHS